MVKLILKNYRSFYEHNPLIFEINDSVIALVGHNNAGKSFVLKIFFEFRHLFSEILSTPKLVLGSQSPLVEFNTSHPLKLFYKYNSRPLELILKFETFKLSVSFKRDNPTKIIPELFIFVDDREVSVLELQKTQKIELRHTNGFYRIWDISQDRLICDITELFKTLNIFKNARYFSSFRNSVNIDNPTPYCDILVGDKFIRSWQEISASNNSVLQQKIKKFYKDIEEVFDYKSFEIIINEQDGRIMAKINGELTHLSSLGSGIIQFILIFSNAIFYNSSLILIEEPETNLHSKLQMDLINRLFSYSDNGIIFTTHNMGLAHSVAGKIYSVIKPNKNSLISSFKETPNFQEFLGEINFSSFPAIGLKKVLLAEGPKDVQVFTQLLRKFKKYKDIMILSLGGSSLINSKTFQEIGELKRIGNEIEFFCWIDSERNFAGEELPRERVQFAKICEKLGIKIKISERKCMESYFPLSVIKKVLPKVGSFGYYENPPWDKNINWKIAQKLTKSDLRGTDLYNFLQNL